LADGLSQLSPESLQIFHHISFDNATFSSEQLGNHLANLRDGLTGFDSSQLIFTDSTMDPALSQIRGRLLAWNPNSTPGLVSDVVDPLYSATDPKDMKEMREIAPADRWSTFIAGSVVLADLDHNTDLAHQNFTTGSVIAGADYRLDDHFTVGALFGYGHTSATLDNLNSSATVDTYSPGLYASYVDGGWYGNALFSYGYNSFSETRNIAIGAFSGSNNGSTDGNQYVGNLAGGYEFKSGAWKFGPAAGVQYVNLGINSITESGPTALNINSQSAESLRTQFGLTARYAAKVDTCYGPMLFTPHFSALWQHECLDDSEGITSQFNQIGAGSFTVQTSSPDRDSALLDLGLDAQVDKELTLFVDYETEAGQSNFFAQSVQAGLKIGF
jgi:outer membrane autotransporter protein